MILLGACARERPRIEVDHLPVLATQIVVGGRVDLGEDGNPRWVRGGWNLPEARAQWSARHQAELILPLLSIPRQGRLHLRAMGARPRIDPTRLRLRVNDHDLPAIELPSALEDFVVELPAGVLRAGHNRIIVGCDSLVEAGPRKLGVLVDRIEVDGSPSRDLDPADHALRLDPNTWIEDQTFTLAHAPLRYRWTHAGGAGQLRLEAIDAQGTFVRVVDRVEVVAPEDSTVLAPDPDLGPLQIYRLVYESDDATSHVDLLSATRATSWRDDVLLIMIDTLRADYLGAYGDATARTATIDSLAHRGTRFTNVDAHSPITGPSHASYFLSRVPSATGMVNNHGGILDDSVPTLAEWLRTAGYDARGTISINPIRARDGFARGFTSYEEDLGAAFLRAGDLTVAIAESLFSAQRRPAQRPWFTFVHLADPHEPYDDHDAPPVIAELWVDGAMARSFRVNVFEPGFLELTAGPRETRLEIRCPAPVIQRRFDLLGSQPTGARLHRVRPAERPTWILRAAREGPVRIAYAFEDADGDHEGWRARYRSEVAATDRQVGRVLAALRRSGRADRTWVVFAADHGESLGDINGQHNALLQRRHFGHVTSLREPYLRVPLILVPPGGSGRHAKKVDDRLAAPIDLVPTLCGALDLDAPPSATGLDLFSPRPDDRDVFLETHAPEAPKTRYGLRTQRYKLIWTPVDDRQELYDLREDPDEAHDLSSIRPELLAAMRARLDQQVEALLAAPLRREQEMDAETVAALKSLGYLD